MCFWRVEEENGLDERYLREKVEWFSISGIHTRRSARCLGTKSAIEASKETADNRGRVGWSWVTTMFAVTAVLYETALCTRQRFHTRQRSLATTTAS